MSTPSSVLSLPRGTIPDSKIFLGEVRHARQEPVINRFRYPLPFFAFRLGELEKLDREITLFSYNKKNIVSIHDADYLKGSGTLREKLDRLLAEKPYREQIADVVLVTNPRYFHYIFNPVSFFYCYDQEGRILCIVAEVNNTFRERHFYILDQETAISGENDREDTALRYLRKKAFHVSPFNDIEGNYTFTLSDISDRLKIQIAVTKKKHPFFFAQLSGEGKAFNQQNLQHLLLRYPITAMLNFPRILWQAGILYFKKGLKVYVKPTPSNALTMTLKGPAFTERFAMKQVFSFLEKFSKGKIVMTLPNHEKRVFGDPEHENAVSLRVYDYQFFWNLIKYGDIAFGEGYAKRLWDTDNLTGLLETILENRDVASDRDFSEKSFGRIVNRIQHMMNHNSIKNSAKNIQAHYDLSNDFFSTFLDPTMTYSSAIFKDCQEDLEAAQYRKIHRMLEIARVQPGDHILEIGSGWGALAMEAARKYGCRVTTITLSKEQQKLVAQRVREAGLEDLISVEIRDYRTMEGKFDKIISVEMFEAVGHENFGAFFRSLDRLLKPDGLVAMQVITIADENYESYRKGVDWIQKYIFPGGLVPSLSAMTEAMCKSSPFMVEKLDNFGIHYAETLRRWRTAFWEKEEEINRLGFDDEFKRIWDYYLAYCEAGFNKRVLGLLQFVLTRPNNKSLPNTL